MGNDMCFEKWHLYTKIFNDCQQFVSPIFENIQKVHNVKPFWKMSKVVLDSYLDLIGDQHNVNVSWFVAYILYVWYCTYIRYCVCTVLWYTWCMMKDAVNVLSASPSLQLRLASCLGLPWSALRQRAHWASALSSFILGVCDLVLGSWWQSDPKIRVRVDKST